MPDTAQTDELEQHGSLGLYLSVFVALCVLTACSFWTYSDFWPKALDSTLIKRVFMIAVSCTKAMLVIMFFMHLKWEANWKWVLTIPASLMSIFLVVVLIPDVGMRMRHASNERMIHAAELPIEEVKEHKPSEDEQKDSFEKHSADLGRIQSKIATKNTKNTKRISIVSK